MDQAEKDIDITGSTDNDEYEYDGNDEISYLHRKFCYMMKRINELISEKYLAQIERKKLEINRLQEQINPHFLYNSLEIVSSMASLNDVDDIEIYVQKLSKILRYNITSKIDETVCLEQEIEMIKEYIYIQQIRFSGMFQTKIKINPGAGQIQVPKFILQPLVENSIHHGLSQMNHFGLICIFCRIVEESLRISVFDNGIGMDMDSVARLNRRLSGTGSNELDSIGMINVSDRLRLHYGKEAELQVRSKLGVYTKINIRVPIR